MSKRISISSKKPASLSPSPTRTAKVSPSRKVSLLEKRQPTGLSSFLRRTEGQTDARKANLPWIEKYRPQNLSEVISHDEKIKTLRRLITKGQLPHLLLYGSPGSGKCLGKGTLVRLFDGSLKKVEDLTKNDYLMGDDGTLRRILSTCHGEEVLYKIKQNRGIDYVVNESHILTLRRVSKVDLSEGESIDIPLKEVLRKPKSWLKDFKGYRVNYLEARPSIDAISNIEIEKLSVGEYYGFELNRNGRFLLSDGTVTHNTSSILALAREMYGPNYRKYILELNASDDRGIDIVRNKIPIFAKTKSDKMRLVILDEADAMTHDAQSALRRVMELFINNCRFCLICNNINKIIDGIKSRCAPMRFGVLHRGSIKDKLTEIIEQEDIEITDDATDTLLEINQDFRQILNTLQCMNSIREEGKPITKQMVVEYLGKPDAQMMTEMIEFLNTKTFKEVHHFLLDLHRQNRINLMELIKDLSHWVIEADLSEDKRFRLLDGLANVEYRIIVGSDTELQLASLVGVWVGNR